MDCSICLGSLRQPADSTIDETPSATVTQVAATASSSGIPVPVKLKPKVTKSNKFMSSTSLSDVSCLSCGHLFHTHCLQNWFQKLT